MAKEKFARTPTMASGGITPEEKIALDAHAKMWIARIMRTDPIEPDKIAPAIEALYAAADADARVVAPSPFWNAATPTYSTSWLFGRESVSAGWGERGGEHPAPSAAPPSGDTP